MSPPHVEGVAGDEDHADVRGVDAADDAHRLEPVLDEIVWVRVDPDVDALALEDRHQFLHRAEERPLGFLGPLGPAGELGVDDVHAEVDGDLNDPLPVAHRGLAGILVGAGPAQHRQHRGDPDAGVGACLAELGDQVVVGAGVVEERDEVAVRGELQVLVAQVRRPRAGSSSRSWSWWNGVGSRAIFTSGPLDRRAATIDT